MKIRYYLASFVLLMSVAIATHAQKETSDCSNPKNPAVVALVKQGLEFEAKRDAEGAIETSKNLQSSQKMSVL